MALNSKGQAAVTDALYFLLIVTGVSILLFSFANSYGNTVREKITSNYNTTFSTDALKTILYSSTPRDPSKSLYDDPTRIEVDHLLAFLKEDYSDDGSISCSAKKVLAKDIKEILSPIATNFDYAFFVSITGVGEKYVYILLKATDTSTSGGAVHYLFCGENPNEGVSSNARFSNYPDMQKALNNLLVSVGQTSAASSRLKLSRVDESGSIDTGSNAEANLIIWSATCLLSQAECKEKDTAAGVFEQKFLAPPWQCIDVTETDLTRETDLSC